MASVNWQDRAPLWRDLAVAVFAQLVLVALLWWGAGLGSALSWRGWSAGAAYALGGAAVSWFAFHRAGVRSLGPGDRVTLVRVALIAGLIALSVDHLGGDAPAVFVVLAAVALLSDLVDGQVARRTGTASNVGARFDIEVDSFLVLVLSAYVASILGVWVLVIGAMRYLFVAGAWIAPWLAEPLPYSRARKIIGATQGVVLVVVSAGVLPHPAAGTLVAVAIALLAWSFGRDIVRLSP